MIKRTFPPGFYVRLHQKDLNLALELACKMGLSFPAAAIVAQELFNSIAAAGGSEFDYSALVQTLEKLANHTVSC